MPFLNTRKRLLQQQLADNRDRLYRLALAWCGNDELADDLVQDALSKAMNRLGQLKNKDGLRAWLYTILANQYRDHCRARRDHDEYQDDISSETPNPYDDVQTQQTVRRVQQAIQELKPDQRQVLTLIDLEDFSYSEVSMILDIPIGTVMSRLNRARQKLKTTLQRDKSDTNVTYLESVK